VAHFDEERVGPVRIQLRPHVSVSWATSEWFSRPAFPA
jgi:hypothetical protein